MRPEKWSLPSPSRLEGILTHYSTLVSQPMWGYRMGATTSLGSVILNTLLLLTVFTLWNAVRVLRFRAPSRASRSWNRSWWSVGACSCLVIRASLLSQKKDWIPQCILNKYRYSNGLFWTVGKPYFFCYNPKKNAVLHISELLIQAWFLRSFLRL